MRDPRLTLAAETKQASKLVERNDEPVATIAVLSDTHLQGRPDNTKYGQDRALQKAIDAARPYQPNLVLLLGDITQDASVEACQRVKAMVDMLRADVIAVPGNHDTANTVKDMFDEPRDRNIANWRLVALDTTIFGQIHGQIDTEKVLITLVPDQGQPTILALHHPPITTSTRPWFQLLGATDLVTALAQRSDVRLVLSGHVHQAFSVVLGATTYIGCSSTWYSIQHHGNSRKDDDGHVGGLILHLYRDGTYDWKRVPEKQIS